MEMAYRERWRAEIAALQKILAGFDLKEECKWGKPTYTMEGKNVVIIQGFKEYCALGFFQGALLKDPKKLLVQLGQVQAARVMKFTSAAEIAEKATTIQNSRRSSGPSASSRFLCSRSTSSVANCRLLPCSMRTCLATTSKPGSPSRR